MSPPPAIPRRKLWLPLTMLLVLLLTVAGAGGLSWWKTRQWHVDLQPAELYGPVMIRLPAGWRVSQRGLVVIAEENAQAPRTLLLRITSQNEAPDPLEFLFNSGMLPMTLADQLSQDLREVEPLDIADGKGIILHLSSRRAADLRQEAIGCVVFNTGQIIVLKLTSPTTNTTANNAIIYQVAQSLRVADEKQRKLQEVEGLPI